MIENCRKFLKYFLLANIENELLTVLVFTFFLALNKKKIKKSGKQFYVFNAFQCPFAKPVFSARRKFYEIGSGVKERIWNLGFDSN